MNLEQRVKRLEELLELYMPRALYAQRVYLINVGNVEYPNWIKAYWIRAADVVRFNVFNTIESTSRQLIIHDSNVRKGKHDDEPQVGADRRV